MVQIVFSKIAQMDDQSTKSSLELNENDEHLDCQSEDQVVNDDALQTEEDLPMDIDYGISEDYVAEVRKPRVGMVFQSDIEAFEFYGQYARSMGFSIRKSSSILPMKSASSEDSCKFGKRLLTGSLVELDTLKTDFDQAELHHNIRMYDDVDEACGNISSPDVHHKQAKGKHVVKGEGIKGQVGQVSDGAVGIVSSHLHNTQGSIELDDKAALNLIITSHTGKRRSMPPDDKAWNHGTKVTNGSKCNYCHKVMKGGGVCRLKHHIARTQFDVDPCYEVPVEVSEKWFRVMYPIAEAMRAKRKRGGASSSTNLNPMDSVSCQEYEVGPVSRQEFETLVRRVALLEDKQNHQNNCLSGYLMQMFNLEVLLGPLLEVGALGVVVHLIGLEISLGKNPNVKYKWLKATLEDFKESNNGKLNVK
ncbi:hypothetical protein GIB67_009598 [Kingdonia uniflora]|uniref:BED-type domain-containing protein n=1 Tax=Kingdonia uniflora TaxID=39325 RepID=A0A7J7M3X7_9MAGN|nr:hypothetical protein GIB67_009598 [Kingdonia uniflora]